MRSSSGDRRGGFQCAWRGSKALACGHDGLTMTELFFDHSTAKSVSLASSPDPLAYRVGWRIRPRGASTEPDETVQLALGQLRDTSPDSARLHKLPLDCLR